jgi:hypothetical protein
MSGGGGYEVHFKRSYEGKVFAIPCRGPSYRVSIQLPFDYENEVLGG